MGRTRLLLFLGIVPLVGAAAAFAGCSTDDGGGPPDTQPDAAKPDAADAGPPQKDAARIEEDAYAPPCPPNDIPVGTGTKFCDLPGADVPDLQVPPEFCIREMTTTPVKEARVIRFAPNGDLFVAAPSMLTVGGAMDGPGAIVVLPDDDGDGRADAVINYDGPYPTDGRACAVVEGENPKSLSCVHGLVFAGGYLYFTRSDEVRRVPYTPGDRAAPAGTSELVAKLGGAALPDTRWTHTLEVTKDGTILVSRGRGDSDLCSPREMEKGAVFALHVENGGPLPLTPELFANGFRNPMYLRCSPHTCGDCYASELSGDNWDGAGGHEKLALLARQGQSFGFPCCVTRDVPYSSANPQGCENVARETVAIPLHDTNFGLDFDRGGFPDAYRHGIFVALHGVFTSFGGTGVVFIQTDPTTLRPSAKATMFAKGFGPKGRATDVAFAPDGRLFVADDTTGRIYWIAPRTLAKPK